MHKYFVLVHALKSILILVNARFEADVESLHERGDPTSLEGVLNSLSSVNKWAEVELAHILTLPATKFAAAGASTAYVRWGGSTIG